MVVNARIEGHDCTLFYDYDYHHNCSLKSLTHDGKIEWLERRMNMIFLDPMKKLTDRNSDVFKALEHPKGEPPMTAMLMIVSLLMNGMEALGSFLTTSESNATRFNEFVDEYMRDWTQFVDSPHHGRKKLSEILWKSYRNGLAHSFAIIHAGIESLPGTEKFAVSNGALQIDGWKLFDDLQLGISKMFSDIRSNAQTKRLFLERFRNVYKC